MEEKCIHDRYVLTKNVNCNIMKTFYYFNHIYLQNR